MKVLLVGKTDFSDLTQHANLPSLKELADEEEESLEVIEARYY